jgi:hypothetical protein
MGNSSSKKNDKKAENFFEGAKKTIKAGVDEEIARRTMLQREVQMAVNIAKARDSIHIFGSLWLALTAGFSIAHLAKQPVPKLLSVPIVIGGVMLGNIADMAYGNKLARVNKEAAYILEHERARFVPFPQAPFARFYSAEERAMLYDKATAVGDLAPFSLLSRSFVPEKKE